MGVHSGTGRTPSLLQLAGVGEYLNMDPSVVATFTILIVDGNMEFGTPGIMSGPGIGGN